MSIPFRSLLFAGILILTGLILTSCGDSDPFGPTFKPTDPNLQYFSFPAGPITTEPLVVTSGNLPNIAVGTFDDPLFGEYHATALLKPQMLSTAEVFPPNVTSRLKLIPSGIYGDTLATSAVGVYEITRRWRHNSWKPDSVIQVSTNPLAFFNFSGRDTVLVNLPNSWTQKYLNVYGISGAARDSVYAETMFGFALIPVGSNTITYISTSASSLQLVLPDTTTRDAFITLRATSFEQVSPENIPPNNIVVTNDFRSTGTISFDISEELFGSRVVSRAELILYENRDALQSSLGPNQIRHNNGIIRLFQINDDDREFLITRDPLTSATRGSDGSYRVNITNFVNSELRRNRGELTTATFHFISDNNSGLIRPNLFINDADSDLGPRLVITAIKPD